MAEAIQDDPKQDAASDIKSNDKVHPKVNGYDTHNRTASRTASDPDAQEMLISSLRSQIQDLCSQVTGLNNKLVKSYDRVSDLEDNLHVASANLRSSNVKISQLELERTEHLSALNTGLLVEKSHVTSELNRLMEKATEEAAQRGQAESAQAAIEKDLDDLSASLFGQANSMVAEARYAQHLSERKAEASERGFKGAEEAVQIMQQHMQALQADKEVAERKVDEMQMVVGKGKWVERRNIDSGDAVTIRLMSSHTPYQEFLLFIAHLRTVHSSTPHPPAMTTLLTLPFLVRLLTEDSESTVRLDLAPSLNWLSRRSVLSAIHTGQLTIEPVSSGTLLQESSFPTPTSLPGLISGNTTPSCALCGAPIFTLEPNQSRPQPSVMTHTNSGSMTSWGTVLFKKPTANSISSTNSRPPSPPRSIARTHSLPQIHIFRVAPQQTANPSTSLPELPTSFSGTPQAQSATTYPLCANGWCLARLRTTCTLWAFLRTGIVEKVWEEEIPNILPPPMIALATNGEKPSVPPRRRGLWKMASALGERAASWGESDKDKDKAKKTSPVLAPTRPASVSSSPAPPPPLPRASEEKRRLPPPMHPSVAVAHGPVKRSVPPPLPKRNDVRRQSSPTTTTTPSALPTSTPATHTPEAISNGESSISGTPVLIAPSTPAPSPPRRPPQRSPPRPSTPTSVPLPESRPHTPPVIVTATTAKATPPPLPRRAAARGSKLITEGLSRPETPAAGTGPRSGADSAPMKVEEDAMRDGDGPSLGKDEEPVEAVKAAVKENGVEHVDAEVVEEKEKVVPKVIVSSSTPSVDTVPRVEDKDDTQNRELPAADAEHVWDEDMQEKMEALVAEGNDRDWEEVKAEEVNATVSGDTHAKSYGEKDAKSIEGKPDEANEAFIGDVTWEERTWKELVRLREEMFWARIGALRQ